MKVRRIPVDLQVQQMSGSLAAYVSLPAAPWEEPDDEKSPKARAREMAQQGRTYVEIGAALGVSAGAVATALGRR